MINDKIIFNQNGIKVTERVYFDVTGTEFIVSDGNNSFSTFPCPPLNENDLKKYIHEYRIMRAEYLLHDCFAAETHHLVED